ncbi:MAG: serine/threonine-protein kinase [Byssovorax sp.]
MKLYAGDHVNHYKLLEPLGAGGQGSVWKVHDPRGGGIERALKIIQLDEAKPWAFDRARREAKILASARHPALVACHGLFEEPNGVVGLLMDLVKGEPLDDLIAAERLGPERVEAVLEQLADALAYLHAEGLAHRDIKPANIILTDAFFTDPRRPGTVKLVDFGIAAPTDQHTQITRPGTFIGTLGYLAPEIVDPATWGKHEGPCRDVFAFGVLAYELLTGGRHPTGLAPTAKLPDYVSAYRDAGAGHLIWPPPGLEGPWADVVRACLALHVADRPRDGAAIRALLRTPSRPVDSRAGSSPRAPHTAPPPASRTEISAPPIVLGARMSQPQTIPEAPLPFIPRPPPRSTAGQRGTSAIALLSVGLLGAAGGALALWFFGRSSPDPPAIPFPAPATAVTLAPVSPAGAAPTGPCRNLSLGFDPRDTRFACPPCAGTPGPIASRDWLLRIHHVSPLPGAPAKVCAQVTGADPVCFPYDELPDRTGAHRRLRVTTDDINEGRVYFSVRDSAGGILAKGFGRRRAGTTRFLESALCSGFVLYLDDWPATLTVMLDEP